MKSSQQSLELDVEVNSNRSVTLPAEVVRHVDTRPGARVHVRITPAL